MIQILNKDNVTLIDIQNKISEIQDYLAESKNSIIDQVVDLSIYSKIIIIKRIYRLIIMSIQYLLIVLVVTLISIRIK